MVTTSSDVAVSVDLPEVYLERVGEAGEAGRHGGGRGLAPVQFPAGRKLSSSPRSHHSVRGWGVSGTRLAGTCVASCKYTLFTFNVYLRF